jgi:PleD family two-component response regulator
VEKLHTNIENTVIPCEENELKDTVSIGTVYPLENMPARADSALYKAKNGARNRVRLYGE